MDLTIAFLYSARIGVESLLKENWGEIEIIVGPRFVANVLERN